MLIAFDPPAPKPEPATPTQPETQREFWKRVISKRAAELADKFNWTAAKPLAEVAQWHDRALRPQEYGTRFSPESPTVKLSGGYNGKRPVYLVKALDGCYHFAWGTYFGRSSGFGFGEPEMDRIFDAATISRLQYAAAQLPE
jgi:hypothetical protein